ncbi:MAG: hypothetical protein EOP06_01985 [Proteobacteria bacterium]|nr:MAG: hypothetical protein EOP06_01985 [Pseudomonadota bacterium]
MLFGSFTKCFEKILLVLALSLSAHAMAAEKMAIFVSGVAKPKDMEKALEKDPALGGIGITVFVNFEDFQKALKSSEYTHGLVPSGLLKYDASLEPQFQLTIKGAQTFKYEVVSLDSTWNKDKIPEGTVGMVNVVGRENAKVYTEELLAPMKFKRVKQVSKIGDLYPLLALGNANYAIFDPKDLEMAQKDFTSKPLKVVETVEQGFPVFIAKKGTPVNAAFDPTKMSADSFALIGYDAAIPYKK